ncbi:ABC transporter permease [Mycoplasmopsis felifaucium]|uniref:ABC transporter permease n=1 Tax=Mycoplasmopsis felifaucium TaxID=35768 RepID=UPI00056413E2|nr:spermidine/putrescine ABC transporter permease [Mycoplasmopsis felifaucium]
MHNKVSRWFRGIFIHLILLLVYIPLFFAAIFSFNKPTEKGFIRSSWNGFTGDNWKYFFNEGRGIALLNSIIIAVAVAVLVVTISLLTCYGMWRQKNKKYTQVIHAINNAKLINPDNIIALGLALLFAALFGTLVNTQEGLLRGIVGHTVMALPYGITLMFPRSEKFNCSQLEAAQDLGYNKVRSWFKTYFVYMIPSIVFAALVSAFLSFDDFIILRTVSNTSTLGTKLYEGEFRAWGLVVGAALLIIVITGNIAYITYKSIAIGKAKRKLSSKNYKTQLFQETKTIEITVKGEKYGN